MFEITGESLHVLNAFRDKTPNKFASFATVSYAISLIKRSELLFVRVLFVPHAHVMFAHGRSLPAEILSRN